MRDGTGGSVRKGAERGGEVICNTQGRGNDTSIRQGFEFEGSLSFLSVLALRGADPTD